MAETGKRSSSPPCIPTKRLKQGSIILQRSLSNKRTAHTFLLNFFPTTSLQYLFTILACLQFKSVRPNSINNSSSKQQSLKKGCEPNCDDIITPCTKKEAVVTKTILDYCKENQSPTKNCNINGNVACIKPCKVLLDKAIFPSVVHLSDDGDDDDEVVRISSNVDTDSRNTVLNVMNADKCVDNSVKNNNNNEPVESLTNYTNGSIIDEPENIASCSTSVTSHFNGNDSASSPVLKENIKNAAYTKPDKIKKVRQLSNMSLYSHRLEVRRCNFIVGFVFQKRKARCSLEDQLRYGKMTLEKV